MTEIFSFPSFKHMANCSCKKFFPTTKSLATVHPLQTKERTDDSSYQ